MTEVFCDEIVAELENVNIWSGGKSEVCFEPRHNKTNIMGLRPAWIQTSLRILQSDQDPCCSLTDPITSRETDSE
jgi:hypothetical protein